VILSAVRTTLVLAGALLISAPAAVASRDPNSPVLRTVASDVRAAKALLLRRAILGSRFHASPSGASPNNNSGSCAGFDPNLRALTETAEVYGDLLADRSDGLLFTSEAEVYVSRAEAAKAQALETRPGAGRCVASLAKKAAGTGVVVVKKKVTPISFTVGGMQARAWDAQLLVSTNGRQVPVEATVFIYRHGRALSSLFFSGLESQAAAQYSRIASAQMARALLHAALK
jgi:hypothetical protein